MEYTLCHACAVAVANGDTSHLEDTAAVDTLPFLAHVGMSEDIDSGTCECCEQYFLDYSHTFEAV